MFEFLKIIEADENLLKDIILELELEQDILNNSIIEIKRIVDKLSTQLSRKNQETISKIFDILPRLVQPALLINDGLSLFDQQSKQEANTASLENETPEAAEQSSSSSSSVNMPAQRISMSDSPRFTATRFSSTKYTSARGSKSLIRKPENLIEDVVKALQEIQKFLLGKQLSALAPFIEKIINVYDDFLKKWRAATLLEERSKLIEVKVEVQFKASKDSFYLMRQELARTILCRDQYGFLRKSNSHGNHAVSISSRLVKKGSLSEGELDPILPGMEKIVVSFCNMLGETLVAEDLTAPTTLIKLEHIVFQKIQERNSDPNEWQSFIEKYKTGQFSADSLIQQFPKLSIEPKEVGAFIQVGKTLHGWSLHDLLGLLQKFEQLQQRLGLEAFTQILPSWISGAYVNDFIENNNKFNHWLNLYDANTVDAERIAENILSEQFNYVFTMMKLREPHQRLKEYVAINYDDLTERKISSLYIEFKKMTEKYSAEQKMSAFAFLTYWPGLVTGQVFDDVVQITKLLKKIPELMPDATVEEIINELPQLYKLFDVNNFTALIISSLLINPCDGKADNYMAEFTRDQRGRISKIKIKGIDNDQALAHAIVRSEILTQFNNPDTGKVDYKKVEVHYPGVKCVLFLMPSMMMQLVSKEVLNQFKLLVPEVFLLNWLAEQYRDDLGYHRLLVNNPAEIDIPIHFDPSSIPTILAKLRRMQQIFNSVETITHQQLFYMMEPILSMFYTKMLMEQHYPLATMSKIYHGGDSQCPTIEEQLEKELDTYFVYSGDLQISLREVLKTYSGSERYYKNRKQSIEDAVKDFIFKHINLSQISANPEIFWPVLRLLSNFDFLKVLPLPPEKIKYLLFQAIVKNEVDVLRFLIQLDDVDVNFVHPEEFYTPLRLAVTQPNPSIAIIDALLKHKKIKPYSFDRKGDSVLSLANPANTLLMEVLIQNGLDIDTPHTLTGKTLIDIAIENRNPDIFIKLIQQGAGKRLNAQQALNFIHYYHQFTEWAEKMQQASSTLATQNSQFAWLLTLNAITQIENPNNNLYPLDVLIEGRIERRFIKTAVMSKLFEFDQNGALKGIKKDNQYGRRAVAFIEHEGQKMHVKSHPEIFATEEGIRLLWRQIFPQGGIAESGVLRFFDKTGQPFPVLISRHIEGENLQKVVQDLGQVKELSHLIDERRFSEVLVMTMLTNPEDDKPDNKILRYFINHEGMRKLEIVGIDNDHAFVFPMLKEKGHRVLQVKTIVACLDQMREPLHPAIRQVVLNLNPGELLKTWLDAVAKRQTLYDDLFSEELRRRFFNDSEQPILTRMPLPIGIVAHMYSTLIRMQSVLKANSTISQIDFMAKVEPSFVAYKYMLEAVENPGARFHELFQRQYSTIVANRFDTLVTGKHILQSAKIPDRAMIGSSADYGPVQALKELQDTLDEYQILNDVKQELLRGKLDAFKKLLLSSSREAILKDIVFAELSPELRMNILRSLHDLSLDYLDVHDCTDIDIDILKPIFENSPNMLAINISGCSKLKVDILDIIAKNCQALEKLYINNLPWDNVSIKAKPIYFPSLQQLWINDARNLKEVSLRVPRLKILAINNAVQLSELDIQGHALNTLSMEGCLMVPEATFHRVLGQSPELLKTLNFVGLPLLSSRLLAWLNASYGPSQWQAKNTDAMLKGGLFILQGLSVNDLDIQKIAYFARRIEHINLVGANLVSWEGYATLLNRMLMLQSIEKNDFSAPIKTPKQLSVKSIVEAFASGFGGQFFSVSRDKVLRKHYLESEEVDSVVAHTASISSVLVFNGVVFTGAMNGSLKIWDAAHLTLIREIKAHASNIKSMVYIASRNILVSGSEDRSIKYWDIDTGLSLKTIVTRSKINVLELLGNTLIVASENGTISLFNALSGEQLSTINAHQNPILALKKISKNQFVTASGDYTTKVWDLNDERCLVTLAGHTGPVTSVEVLQGGHLLATGSLDKTIKIWDLFTGECINTLSAHSRKITALTLIGNYLLSGSEDETIFSWEIPVRHIPLDSARFAKPFKILRQDALLRVQCLTKEKFILLNFIADFIVQIIGNSGVGITKLLEDGELFFAINNKDKYFAVDNLLVGLNEFIHNCSLLNTASVSSLPENRSSYTQSSSTSGNGSRFWTSAAPSNNQTPKMFALKTRLINQSLSNKQQTELTMNTEKSSFSLSK